MIEATPAAVIPPPEPIHNHQMMAMSANGLINNPAYKAAISAVKAYYTEQMIDTKPEESATREHLHKCIHALADIHAALTAFVERGKLEKSMAIKREKAKK